MPDSVPGIEEKLMRNRFPRHPSCEHGSSCSFGFPHFSKDMPILPSEQANRACLSTEAEPASPYASFHGPWRSFLPNDTMLEFFLTYNGKLVQAESSLLE